MGGCFSSTFYKSATVEEGKGSFGFAVGFSTMQYSNETLEAMSRQVELKLKDFGVDVKVVAVHPGPVITRFELNPAPGIKGSQIINLSKDMITNTSKDGYIGSCEAIKKLDYLKNLSTINKDILYISGEKDMGAPAMAMEEMHHITPNSKYECISGAAHILNLECAEKVSNTILEFLN